MKRYILTDTCKAFAKVYDETIKNIARFYPNVNVNFQELSGTGKEYRVASLLNEMKINNSLNPHQVDMAFRVMKISGSKKAGLIKSYLEELHILVKV